MVNFLIFIFIGIILPQDIEGCTDSNALNCDNNPPTMEEDESADWWNHCATCPETPCNGFYNPEANIDNNSCQYNQVPTWEEIEFQVTPGQIQIDWSNFVPPVEDIDAFVIQRCLEDGTCAFVEEASNTDTYLETTIIDYYDWESGENLNYYMGVFYSNNGWWSQAKGKYNFYLGCMDPYSPNYNPDALVDDGTCGSIDVLLGDVNGDEILNILDVVQIVNFVLGQLEFDETQVIASDINEDGITNILDIVTLVNIILS